MIRRLAAFVGTFALGVTAMTGIASAGIDPYSTVTYTGTTPATAVIVTVPVDSTMRIDLATSARKSCKATPGIDVAALTGTLPGGRANLTATPPSNGGDPVWVHAVTAGDYAVTAVLACRGSYSMTVRLYAR